MMKSRNVAALFVTAFAGLAIAAAPVAAAAANPTTTTDNGRTTTTDKNGHTAIVVLPAPVSAPNVYGPFTSPWPLALFD